MKIQFQTEESAIGAARRSERAFTVDEPWKEINGWAPSQAYPAAVELFQQGSPVEDVYFIDSGLVKLVYLDQNGRELIFGLSSSGGLAGATSAILQKAHPVTAVTSTRCHLRRIPANVFCQLLRTDAQLSWHLHQSHCCELYKQVAQVAQLECLSVQHRIEQLLWQLISAMELKEPQREIRLQLPLKHWEIAELIAVTPEHLSRVLKRMQQEGVVRREKGWIIVPDPQRLCHTSYF